MQAYVIHQPGSVEALQLQEMPIPAVKPGWVLIRIKAFGLNRAEVMTRQGHSGDAVPWPRIIGIECVGEVADASDSDLSVGRTVATAMGGLGRSHDGSYAEYTLVPRSQVMPLQTSLSWAELAALPDLVAAGSPLTFAYRDSKGAETERTITPWGWYTQNDELYFNGLCHLRDRELRESGAERKQGDAERTFRADRVLAVMEAAA